MALLRNVNTKAKADKNSGFGTNANSYGGRFVNKDGTPNIEKRGMHLLRRISWYHTMTMTKKTSSTISKRNITKLWKWE